MQHTESANGVLTVRLYEPQTARSLVERLKGLGGWATAQVRAQDGVHFESRTDELYRAASVLEPPALPQHFADDFGERLKEVVSPVISQRWRINLPEHSGTQVIRYMPGGHYVSHSDAGQDYANRYFTVVCYLNDDFEGGRTLFPSLGHAVAPACGMASVFPADYIHSAERVTRGEKYVFISWVVGPRSIRWI